ncbi:MAG: glutathione peroxidase [Elusimicrobiaceae bacterium]|nr:glutathione peroxidase [Elusimicrobiaceae bacterium]
MNIYDQIITDAKGKNISLSDYKGKVLLIVNTATGCGFTPHYEDLEKMYEKYHEKGLEIIDIPCNQFGGQAPGTEEEIHTFCTLHYNTKFPQMKKSDVNGNNELPLYTYLKSQQGFKGFTEHKHKEILEKMLAEKDPNWKSSSDIKWNFTKFIVDRQGNVVARFEPTSSMDEVEKCVATLI